MKEAKTIQGSKIYSKNSLIIDTLRQTHLKKPNNIYFLVFNNTGAGYWLCLNFFEICFYKKIKKKTFFF